MREISGSPLSYAKCEIPEGRSGDWVLERFEVRPQTDPPLPDSDTRPAWARAAPGTYTKLRRGPVDFMTDLFEEWWSQRSAMEEAVRRGGDVLVTGLGLGMFADTVLRYDGGAVRRVTVLEMSPDVIKLAAPHLHSLHPERLEIVECDAFRWRPPAGVRYGVVWHDIWPSPYEQTSVDESRHLMERFAPHAEWQGSWALEYRALAGLES